MGKTKKGKNKRVYQDEQDSVTKKPKEYGLTDKLSRLFFSWMRRKLPPSTMVLTAEQYEIKGLICEGTFGQVMMATNIYTKVVVAAKLERMDTTSPQLQTEYTVYEILGSDVPGFIKIFYYGPCNKLFNVLIMELLGPDLDDLLIVCNGVFSHKTVLMIALQTLMLMKHIHSKNIIYRDVKPENFCIGHRFQNKERIIHIVDFGLSKLESKPNDSLTSANIHYEYLIGTARYMSVNAHLGVDQSKRDDLESLGYMYVYFLTGKLPWIGLSRFSNLEDHYRNIAEIKQTTTPHDLINVYPEFEEYLTYTKSLKFRAEPDYGYLEKLLKDAFTKNGYDDSLEFDWTPIMNKRFLKQAIKIDPDE